MDIPHYSLWQIESEANDNIKECRIQSNKKNEKLERTGR
jgi:hypothetical protein